MRRTGRACPDLVEKRWLPRLTGRAGACVDFVNRDGVSPRVVGHDGLAKALGGRCGLLGVTPM
jgi:hypothetical protein